MIKIMLLFQEDIKEPGQYEVESGKVVLKFVVRSKNLASFSIVSNGSELGNVYTGITPTSSNIYLYQSEFEPWKNKSNVNRNAYAYGLF